MQKRDFIKLFGFIFPALVLSGCTKSNVQSEGKRLKHVEIHLVEHCNLNCKYCSHFSCIAEEEYYDIKEYEQDLKQLSKITNSGIEIIQLLGGEPLLHPKINKIFDITREYFPHSQIDILTNAILLDNKEEEFWRTLSRNNIYLVPSIYPLKLNWKSILEKAEKYNVNITTDGREEKITLNNISNHTIHYFAKFNIDEKGTQPMNKYCAMRELCANFVHGKLYPCFAVSNIKHFNKKFKKNIPVTKKDYIDIYKAKNIEELISLVSNPTPFCKYCNKYEGGGRWESLVNHNINEWLM